MVDLTTNTIRNLFYKQIRELTERTLPREESFNFQYNGGWLK